MTRALIAAYLKEPTAVRYYRERLFEKITKKAIEQAEYLYKNRGKSSSSKGDGRLFVENKRLRKENEGLHKNELDLQTKIASLKG